MATSVEILRALRPSSTGAPMLAAIAAAARSTGDKVRETSKFEGLSDWLILYGVGAPVNDEARKAQLARGGRVLMWDLGYIERKKIVGHLRMSIDTDHPQQWLDKTPADGSRWRRLGIELREDANEAGPIVLVGIGRKSRVYLKTGDWERRTHQSLAARFPGRRVVYRPKGRDELRLPCDRDDVTPIADLLRGASLVVCKHSNVAVDAAIAGVPFHAEDGAAMWLQQREFTSVNRMRFLQRLAFWQWRATEAAQAWAFAKEVSKT